MKIISFKEFAKLPSGTIFSYYDPNIFLGLWRKEETIYDKSIGFDDDYGAIDYLQRSLLPYHLTDDEIEIGGKERWGEFSWDQQYAVYEEEDLKTLKELLNF
jgi:hypothetical protein